MLDHLTPIDFAQVAADYRGMAATLEYLAARHECDPKGRGLDEARKLAATYRLRAKRWEMAGRVAA